MGNSKKILNWASLSFPYFSPHPRFPSSRVEGGGRNVEIEVVSLQQKMYINVHKEVIMISTAFTEFRKKTAAFLDMVENGETVLITRHGRPIAEIVPPAESVLSKSWKRPAVRMRLKGISLSRQLLEQRAENRI